MAVTHIFIEMRSKKFSEDSMNCQQCVNEQMIGTAAPSLEEQTNYMACLDQRGEKKNDAIIDCRKTKCVKRKFKVKDE